MLHSEKSFPYSKRASHEKVHLSKFQLGTLVTSTFFFVHFEQDGWNGMTKKAEASFYHDIRKLEILLERKNHLSFKYDNIRQIMVDFKEDMAFIYFHLINPPEVSQKESSLDNKVLKRVKCFSNLSSDIIGRSNTLCLQINGEESLVWEVLSRLFFRCFKQPVAVVVMDTTLFNAPGQNFYINLGHFGCTYMLHAIVSRNFTFQIQNLGHDMEEILKVFKEYTELNSEYLYEALVEVLNAIDKGIFFHYRTAVFNTFKEKWYNGTSRQTEKFLLPPKMRKVWRVIVTPTRFMFYPAEINFENRIIRNYDSNYAIRVSFRDENFKNLSFGGKRVTKAFITDVLTTVILDGINIGSRHFTFLGWSNSQLRDHSVFMYAEDSDGNTSESIRSWMGNFTHIKSVAKFMARMGQCFSHSEAASTIKLDLNRIKTVPDIFGGENPVNGKPYVFSDGIGKISMKLMRELSEELEFGYVPSAIQFRFAGYKGMLTADPTLPDDTDIIFRDSQKKFECSSYSYLEVVNRSKPVEVLLNRSIITILDQKKIRATIFLKMQQAMLKHLTEMLFDGEQAADYLTSHSALPKFKFKELLYAGIYPNSEPFFRNMLLSEHRVAIENLRMKSRLKIDYSEGRNMYGVLDESGILQYGQVFVQYTINIENHPEILEKEVLNGNVLVTKNPCLRLGDVRKFIAIDVPGLHHIVDCIVFPQKGPRPHPNEMAGSDLDGDEYTVIWCKELLFHQNSEPAHFPIAEETVHHGRVSIYDMLDFLTDFIVNDQVGVISNAHLALADSQGLSSQVCQAIAEKHSIAIDFAKSGHSACLNDDEKPKKYPDFMGKGCTNNSYPSRKVLGKLFRDVKEYEEEYKIALVDRESINVDEYLVYPGWENYKDWAEKMARRYSKVFSLLLNTYGVMNEYDACGKAYSIVHNKADRQEKLDIEDILTAAIKHIWKMFSDEFYKDLIQTDTAGDEVAYEILKKASACYIVSYSNPETSLSFPWIFYKHLINIRLLMKNVLGLDKFYHTRNQYIDTLHQRVVLAFSQSNLETLDFGLQRTCESFFTDSNNMVLIEKNQLELPKLLVAFLILLNWARKSSLISDTQSDNSKMSPKFFLEIFMLSIKNGMFLDNPTYTSLIVNFFNFSSEFRFSTAAKNKTRLKMLGKMSSSVYHSLALGGDLKCLHLFTNPDSYLEISEMEPLRISRDIVTKYFGDNYDNLKLNLENESGAIDITIRELKDHCLVSATGNISSLRFIKKFLMNITKDNIDKIIGEAEI